MIRTLMLVCTLALGCQHISAAESKPNIIFILSDDLAMGDLGCYGQKLIKTPNLDRMAREGTLYSGVLRHIRLRPNPAYELAKAKDAAR